MYDSLVQGNKKSEKKPQGVMPDGKWEHSVNMNSADLVWQNFHVFLLLLPNPDIPMQ